MAWKAGNGFDFDDWVRLARKNPEAFEARRRRAIEAVIRDAPEPRRHRLRGLQWRIDHTRHRAGDPLTACAQISRMMWERLLGEHGLLETLASLDTRRLSSNELSSRYSTAARVIPFPNRKG